MSDPEVVKVKLKKGSWEIEFSCPEGKVKQVVENLLSGMENVVKEGANTLLDRKQQPHSSATCKGLIEALWMERWFTAEKSLAEVHEELSRRGYNYDRTAVSHSLTDFVRENILIRTGAMRSYRYVQKKPPEVSP